MSLAIFFTSSSENPHLISSANKFGYLEALSSPLNTAMIVWIFMPSKVTEFLNRVHHLNMFDVVYCSKSEKGDKELMVKDALASTKIWEARYVKIIFA